MEILYDEIPEEGTVKVLPLGIESCGQGSSTATVVTVNEKEIEPINIELGEPTVEEGCTTVSGQIILKEIGEHFTRGINRFEVKFGDQVTEVILEIEL